MEKAVKKLLVDHAKTKRHIEASVLGAAGWDLQSFDPEVSKLHSVFLYLYDLPTKKTLLLRVEREMFLKLSDYGGRDINAKREFVDSSAQLVYNWLSGKPHDLPDGMDEDTALAILLSVYAGTTSVLQQSNGLCDGGHFFVLIYRNSDIAAKMHLRPFAMEGGNVPIAASDFLGYVSYVIDRDRARNPQWFA